MTEIGLGVTYLKNSSTILSMSENYLNARIGREHKQKLEEIADKQERSMTGQIRIMIDKTYDKVVNQ